jgi:hypothetical protein
MMGVGDAFMTVIELPDEPAAALKAKAAAAGLTLEGWLIKLAAAESSAEHPLQTAADIVLAASVAKSSEGRELAELRRLLRGDAEQLADEFHLGDHISFARPSHPTLSDHAHRLNATQGSSRCPHRPITLRQPGSAFYIAVVLLHYVVEVFALSQFAASWNDAVLLQLVHRRRVGAVLIHVNHPW